MRGFDTDFWFGVIVCVPVLVSVIVITKVFQLNFTVMLLTVGALIWLILSFLTRRMLRDSPKETPHVYCEWEGRINGLDFDANQKSTISDLQTLSFTLEEAVGKKFLFHTEPNLKLPDMYFEGIIVRDKTNQIVIRALKPLP